ncbi:hypothetical protein EDB19DRAFT_1741074 [Suillus lakei]|nr:hypothetical protein EDB19DRAFT_1741074 [Suillus lakei]
MSTAYTFQSPSVTLEKGAYRMRAPRSTRPGSSLSQSLLSAKQPALQSSHSQNRKLAILIVILAFASITCFVIAYHLFTTRFARSPSSSVLVGLHNQRIALENALVLAQQLNRTLLVPFPPRFLVLGSKAGLRHCPLVPIGIPTPDECSGYNEWTSIPWDHLVDLHAIGEKVGVKMIQWDGSPVVEWMKKLNIDIFEADTLTLQDVGPYDFRFLDTFDDVSPTRDKYLYSIYIPALAQAPERLVQIGTLFGSSRLRLRQGASKSVRGDVRSGMTFSNADLSHVGDTIYEALGAVYIGADNARLVWWKLVHLVCGLDLEETLALEQQLAPLLHEDLDPPLIHPGCAEYSGTIAETERPSYIAPDSPNPTADPLFRLYEDLSVYILPIPLKAFLIPVLDAMVLARAREVVVTDGSTLETL